MYVKTHWYQISAPYQPIFKAQESEPEVKKPPLIHFMSTTNPQISDSWNLEMMNAEGLLAVKTQIFPFEVGGHHNWDYRNKKIGPQVRRVYNRSNCGGVISSCIS